MGLAIALGDRNHYKVSEIQHRHFLQSSERAGLAKQLVRNATEDIVAVAWTALAEVESA